MDYSPRWDYTSSHDRGASTTTVIDKLTGKVVGKPYRGKPDVRNSWEGGWKRDHGSRIEAHGESRGIATGPYRARASALPDGFSSIGDFRLTIDGFGDRGIKGPSIQRFGGGLTTLPPWVRRLDRVTRWVTAKIAIYHPRLRCRRVAS